jgi:hypothetical protein
LNHRHDRSDVTEGLITEIVRCYIMGVGGPSYGWVAPGTPEARSAAVPAIRFEKRWLDGLSVIKVVGAGLLLAPFIFMLWFLFSITGADRGTLVLAIWLVLIFMLPIIVYMCVVVLRTRPATLEMDERGVRLMKGDRVVKEIPFGPDVEVGVVLVGYWDDLSPGLFLRAAGVDENDFSMFDRRGFGPLYGYRFRGGGRRIVVTAKQGWDVRWIQYMWAPLMYLVDRHHMRTHRSLHSYLEKRRRMGLPAP